jgi:hypothetical protein
MVNNFNKMKGNRAVLLLKSLNSEELRWFQKFVQSPYYNSNQHLVALYGLLRKLHPDFPPEKISPEILFKKLFPHESFHAPTIRLLTHRLANLIEDFLVCEVTRHDKVVYDKLLVKSLGERNAYGLFEKKTYKLLQDLDAKPSRDANYYRHKLDLHLQYFGHPATNRHSKKSEDLQSGMKNLDMYFTLNKLRLASAIKARENIMAEESEIPYMNAVLEQVDERHPLARLYHQVFGLQCTPDDTKVFAELRDTFVENIELFNLEDKRLVLGVLLNFCTRRINNGFTKFSTESFRLYKLGLEKEFILFNHEITSVTFINIVSLATVIEEFSWTEEFIGKYSGYLDLNVKEEVKRFSLGLLMFRKKNYEAALEQLQYFTFSKKLLQISANSLLVRIFIELCLQDKSYFELTYAKLNTFEKYIRNNFQDNPTLYKGYISFTNHSRKFIKIKEAGGRLEKLKSKIERSKNMLLKDWLLEKVND